MYGEDIFLVMLCVTARLVWSQTTAGLDCTSLIIPTWLGIEYNLTNTWMLQYTCEYGYSFTDEKPETKEVKSTTCTQNSWLPKIEGCYPLDAKDVDTLYAEPVEAKNSRIIGTTAIGFLISECILLILLDIPIWKRLFCTEIPTLMKRRFNVRQVMEVAAAATKFKSKKNRRQSEIPMLTRREMNAKKLIL